jgi:deazaflavin-dependent oxidoreductase (nitroreductase family)
MSDFTSDLIADLRANAGQATSGPFVGRQMVILTTTGAKTGSTRTTPLVYSTDGDDVVIVASKGGAPSHPAWYHNLVADPHVTVEIGGERYEAHAHVANATERRRLYDQHAELHPGFTEYETKTDRVIPVIVLRRDADEAQGAA